MTPKNMRGNVAALLIISAILLGILVPGGPIETRSFSHIPPLILGAFNTFLTTLGIGSLALAYFVLRERHWACGPATLCGVSYFAVYALDIGKIFPVSADAMPSALFVIEVLGMLVSVPLTLLSLQLVPSSPGSSSPVRMAVLKREHVWLMSLTVLAGIGIIIFATMSAMGL